MAGPRRPGFYLGVLVAGFIAGGALTALLRQTMPESAARTFFTSTWTANFGPVSADLLVISFTLGPIGLHVSLLSLIGRFWDLFANLDERDFRHTESASDTVRHHINILDAVERRDHDVHRQQICRKAFPEARMGNKS